MSDDNVKNLIDVARHLSNPKAKKLAEKLNAVIVKESPSVMTGLAALSIVIANGICHSLGVHGDRIGDVMDDILSHALEIGKRLLKDESSNDRTALGLEMEKGLRDLCD